MTTPQFVDISVYQGNIDFIAYVNWARQWDGIARVAIKSSEGTGFTDPLFHTNRAKALAAGINEIYYYHFGRPDLGNSADAEANWQRSVVGNVRPNDRIILDLEVNAVQATGAWAYAWLAQQESNYSGNLPGIYASSAYILARLQDTRLKKYRLWVANWQFTPDERPPVPAPWSQYDFVQYTDKASIPGIPGVVDANIFLGKEPSPEETIVTIDLTNGTVASHFEGSDTIWKCKGNGFLVGFAILNFYRSFGGRGLCGLEFLGLPTSNETSVPNRPGVVYQRFERGVVCYDPNLPHTIDNPPGAEKDNVYLLHIDEGLGMDIRVAQLAVENAGLTNQISTLQGEITALKALLASSNLGKIGALTKQIQDDVDLIMKLVQVQ